MSPELALRLGMGLKECSERWTEELRYERASCTFRLDAADRKTQLEVRVAQGQTSACEEALKKEAEKANRPFFEEPSFTVPVAFLAGVVLAGAAAVGITIAVLRIP